MTDYTDIDMLESVLPTIDWNATLRLIDNMAKFQRLYDSGDVERGSMLETSILRYLDQGVDIIDNIAAYYELTGQQYQYDYLWERVAISGLYW